MANCYQQIALQTHILICRLQSNDLHTCYKEFRWIPCQVSVIFNLSVLAKELENTKYIIKVKINPVIPILLQQSLSPEASGTTHFFQGLKELISGTPMYRWQKLSAGLKGHLPKVFTNENKVSEIKKTSSSFQKLSNWITIMIRA